MIVAFSIPGQPVAKGRPRFARRGARIMAYTDAKTATYENRVRAAAMNAMVGIEPLQGPVALMLTLNLQIPASWSNKRRGMAAVGTIAATKKPDADNILKGIKDGCNGIVWRDDAQVIHIVLHKKYSETPGAYVEVIRADGVAA